MDKIKKHRNMKRKPLERFLEKIKIDVLSQCWNWTAYKDRDGYGNFSYITRKNEKAHKASYMMFIGEIPSGMLVCHKCDNPKCVNPDHLFLGTCLDNLKDRNNKNRQAKGEKLWSSKLTESDVVSIRKLYTTGLYTTKKLGKMFDVSSNSIRRIILRKSWKHVK